MTVQLEQQSTLRELWQRIFHDTADAAQDRLLQLLDDRRQALLADPPSLAGDTADPEWYRGAVIYCLYVDAYAGDFDGLTGRLDYLQKLGVNTLWLLPILDSPMRDQGFDISDFRAIRPDLGGNEAFVRFVDQAHARGIRILFDMAVNHSSDEHPWFREARQNPDSPYRDYYIWSDQPDRYLDARLLFKGMVDSNWEYNEATGDYYFHRFYAFQPDLNYRNPDLLIDMIDNMLFWKARGVDGLRMDAIPFIWKEEGTDCEDLPTTHSILKLIRAALDYCQPGTLLMAEANMEPREVVSYFGDADECQTAYHFPLMPQFYMALAEADYRHIRDALSPEVTPMIPESCCWMSFLRCHDELTLEFVTPDVRERMNRYYLHHPQYSFREGEGIAGRLFYLLREDPDRMLLMHSMLCATEGSPILYYGDEVGMGNDQAFFEQTSRQTGFRDARFLNRGPMDWSKVERALEHTESVEHQLFEGIRAIVRARREFAACFHGPGRFLDLHDPALFGLARQAGQTHLEIYHNLSDQPRHVELPTAMRDVMTGQDTGRQVTLAGHAYCWLTPAI